MYKKIAISNYKHFNEFTMDLKPITLISGKNNVGKSSVLESIFLFHDYANPDVFFKLQGFRGMRLLDISAKAPWEALFNNANPNTPMHISLGDGASISLKKNTHFATANAKQIGFNDNGTLKNAANHALDCEVANGKHTFYGVYALKEGIHLFSKDENPIVPNEKLIQYFGPNTTLSEQESAEYFSMLVLSNKKDRLINILQLIDENIIDITTIVLGATVQLYYKKNDGSSLPIYSLGDGVRKLLFFALIMLAKPGCILLLDEVENGFHYTILSKFWEIISTLVKSENCQIIATTHSYECINGALEGVAATAQQASFNYVRLDKTTKDEIAPKHFSHEMLTRSIKDDWEVR